ncbi:DUF305 domain-containing protein [Streptomyces evansiae]|uniref:DUF305 domain-containing protein n=1 Tax=Streptomyces evansiae TaxID=3075535 RepID=UPI0028878E2D|nr:DUF305 domain-containing protein [Streptomyces sp. DSM 41859]MDT0421655.1 DUF305 domain-containing protein [Streptomyces sp. DSM 41859]
MTATAGHRTAVRRAVRAGLGALLCAALAAGCGADGTDGTTPRSASAPVTGTSRPVAEASPPPAVASTPSPGGLGPTDTGWLHLSLAMEEQSLALLELAPTHGADPALTTWAGDLAQGQRADLTTLRALLAAAGLDGENPHEGHDMPGMVNAAERRALERARGTRFDELLRAALREHLAQTRTLATALRRTDGDARVHRLARRMGERAAKAEAGLTGP